MEKWLANIVDAFSVLFCGFAVLSVVGLVLAVGFYAGAALGPVWWIGVCLLIVAGIVGWAWLETIRVDETHREFWAGKRRD